MSIKINENICVGCSSCVEVCPGNLIKLRKTQIEGEKIVAQIKHIEDCWGCTSCIKACPKQAISFFLGADIGGKGSLMTVKDEKEKATWTIEKPDGEKVQIVINKNDANKY